MKRPAMAEPLTAASSSLSLPPPCRMRYRYDAQSVQGDVHAALRRAERESGGGLRVDGGSLMLAVGAGGDIAPDTRRALQRLKSSGVLVWCDVGEAGVELDGGGVGPGAPSLSKKAMKRRAKAMRNRSGAVRAQRKERRRAAKQQGRHDVASAAAAGSGGSQVSYRTQRKARLAEADRQAVMAVLPVIVEGHGGGRRPPLLLRLVAP